MHVAPAHLRSVRRDGVTLHFAVLGTMAWVLAEFPPTGSRGTFAEAWCERPHWGVALTGDAEIELTDERQPIAPGTVFHVPAGVRHRFMASGGTRTAAFEPVTPDAPLTDERLRSAGFEPARPSARLSAGVVAVVAPRPGLSPGPGDVVAEADRMGDLLLTRARFGRRSNFASEPCDQPHWGFVTMGSLAIEWEDDVEVLGAGDVFHCPAGPPGHRLQSAEAAAIIDFTPVEAFHPGERVASWRRSAAEGALREAVTVTGVQLRTAALG